MGSSRDSFDAGHSTQGQVRDIAVGSRPRTSPPADATGSDSDRLWEVLRALAHRHFGRPGETSATVYAFFVPPSEPTNIRVGHAALTNLGVRYLMWLMRHPWTGPEGQGPIGVIWRSDQRDLLQAPGHHWLWGRQVWLFAAQGPIEDLDEHELTDPAGDFGGWITSFPHWPTVQRAPSGQFQYVIPPAWQAIQPPTQPLMPVFRAPTGPFPFAQPPPIAPTAAYDHVWMTAPLPEPYWPAGFHNIYPSGMTFAQETMNTPWAAGPSSSGPAPLNPSAGTAGRATVTIPVAELRQRAELRRHAEDEADLACEDSGAHKIGKKRRLRVAAAAGSWGQGSGSGRRGSGVSADSLDAPRAPVERFFSLGPW